MFTSARRAPKENRLVGLTREEPSEIPSAALPDLGAAFGLSADLGTQLRQNIDGKNGQVTGSAQRAQLRCGRKSDKLGRAEDASGSLALSPKKPSKSVRNLAQEGVA
jgi:hypothetical protein